MKAILFLLTASLLTGSCHHNRMRTDEKTLVKEILTEEQQRAREESLRAEREKQLADSLAKLPKGYRFGENRSIDPEKPPLVIDLAGRLDSIRDLRLSNVASEINYIRMEAVPDSTLPHDMKFRYYLMDHYIVALNLYGIHLFSKEGKYIRTVVKNELDGIRFDKERGYVTAWYDYTLKGGTTSAWSRGNSLFYEYKNSTTGQDYIMEYNCFQDQPSLRAGFDPEDPDRVTGLGQILIDLNHGNIVPPKPRKHQGMWTMETEGFYQGMDLFSPDRNTYIRRMHGENMMGVLDTRGDTLATFRKLEQVKNYAKSVMRGTDYGIQYEKGGNLFFRSDFSDTVFQVIPPNRLLPVYVLNLGKYKTSKQEGIDPGFDLQGKIIPQDWADTKNFIFLTFTRDNYDCPNTRKNKSVKIYHALFSKVKQQLFVIKGDPTDYAPQILENDLDGGLPVWPLSYMIGRNGEILVSLKGNELKTHVQTIQFQQSGAPASQKGQLKELAGEITENEDVLMIVN